MTKYQQSNYDLISVLLAGHSKKDSVIHLVDMIIKSYESALLEEKRKHGNHR